MKIRNAYRDFSEQTRKTIAGNGDEWFTDGTSIEGYLEIFRLDQSALPKRKAGKEYVCLDFMGRGYDPQSIFDTCIGVSMSHRTYSDVVNNRVEVIGDVFKGEVWRKLNALSIDKGGIDAVFF